MRGTLVTLFSIACLAWALDARAQVLPSVQLPGVQLPRVVEPALRGAGDAARGLPARVLRSRELLERHRAELDRDPRGELVVRAEVVAIDITAAALASALQADFAVRRTSKLPDLGVEVTVLQTPPGWSARRGLAKLRKLDPAGTYDFNHVYLESETAFHTASNRGPDAEASALEPAGRRARIGLVDGGVETRHAALRDSTVHEWGCGGTHISSTHGTAVASLLAGSAGQFQGAAAGAELFVADVYCDSPSGGAVDAIAAAFGWLARERVPVINVSLVGPRNALLKRVVASLERRGFLVVAAVGNDGPAAPPLYPAAYAGVVGVTAVDAKQRVLIEACRGKHVRFAAPGADIPAAVGDGADFATVRGTSFAAPIVAGLLARELPAPDPARAPQALTALASRAVDLGAHGRDEIYGDGFVGAGLPAVSPATPPLGRH